MSNDDLMGADASTYANIFSYMGLPLTRELKDDVDAVVMGVPYDLATSGRSGTRFGPTGIRQASAQLRWEKKRWPYDFALNERFKVIDYGDLDFEIGKHEQMMATAEQEAARITGAGKTLLTFGGDHFVTLPIMRGVAKTHGKLAMVHFDAHTDNETSFEGPYHGSMFHHAPREGILDADKTVQIGIRTEYDYATHPFKVLNAAWSNNHTVDEILAETLSVIGDAPVYLSLDIDCLDPAFAPGTGTPVAGGMTSDKVMQIIRGLKGLNIVAMDVMEVAPAYDHAELTSLAAATIALDMLYTVAAGRD